MDIATIKAQRAATKAARKAKLDPLHNPFAALIARQIIDQMILDKAAGKMRLAAEYVAMMQDFSIFNRRQL